MLWLIQSPLELINSVNVTINPQDKMELAKRTRASDYMTLIASLTGLSFVPSSHHGSFYRILYYEEAEICWFRGDWTLITTNATHWVVAIEWQCETPQYSMETAREKRFSVVDNGRKDRTKAAERCHFQRLHSAASMPFIKKLFIDASLQWTI